MEILTVARIQSSRFALKRERVNLSQFISGILDEYEELFSGKGLEVACGMDTEPVVSVDKKLFAKVISNLFSNACHYSGEGEQVRIQVSRAENGAVLSVENTGVHIPEQEISGLFDAFARQERSRSRETGGSGLGLTIVRIALELHGFTYRMENTADGIRFTVLMEEEMSKIS